MRFNAGTLQVYTTKQAIMSMAVDEDGTFWVGTAGGLARWQENKWYVYTTENSMLPSNDINSLAVDEEGTLWVGTWSGLAHFQAGTWQVYKAEPNGLPNDIVLSLAVDNGVLWAGTYKGLARFSPPKQIPKIVDLFLPTNPIRQATSTVTVRAYDPEYMSMPNELQFEWKVYHVVASSSEIIFKINTRDAFQTISFPQSGEYKLVVTAYDIHNRRSEPVERTLIIQLPDSLPTLMQKIWSRFYTWFLSSPPWIQLGFVPIALTMLWIFVLGYLWAFQPHILARWAMINPAGMPPPPIERVIQWITLAYWAGNTPHAIKGWLHKHRKVLYEQCFTNRTFVKERQIFEDLGFNQQEIQTWKRQVENRQPAHLWINGPGGYGKSALAFRIVREFVNIKKRKYLIKRNILNRPCIPILVDEDWKDSFIQTVSSFLIVNGSRPTESMVKRMAHRGWLLFIIDSLSERTVTDPTATIGRLAQEGFLKYSIITSRDPRPETPSAFERFTVMEMGPIPKDKIGAFIRLYAHSVENTEPVEKALENLYASSKKSVGEFRFRKFPKCMI